MSFEPKQIQMICLEDLVLENHIYRKFLSLWNLDLVQCELSKLEAESDHKGYGIYRIFLWGTVANLKFSLNFVVIKFFLSSSMSIYTYVKKKFTA